MPLLRLSRRVLAGKIINPGSSLLNPRSNRAKVRKMMATHHAQQENFEQQALFANLGGGGKGRRASLRDAADAEATQDAPVKRGSRAAKPRAQRQAQHRRALGGVLAEQVKSMTDSEWEAVPLPDKHAFVQYMARLLKEHPTEATEQQRRRFFETTMTDPRSLDPGRTVQDPYERVKLGLPVELKHPQRTMGVTQAIYDTADASLFDPGNVHKLENAMTHMKQVFADYVRHKREGRATEQERRTLANLTADLNVETQRHLANLFKYAEEKLRVRAMEEQRRQLNELARLRALVRSSRKDINSNDGNYSGHDDKREAGATSAEDDAGGVKPARRHRRETRESIGKALGVDADVVVSLLTELAAQEKFLQFCEVFARLTLGSGFRHTAQDETLDAYVDSLRRLYSVDAQKLSTLEVVQYMAAKDAAQPVEWARRWYERALLVPLQHTPEYRKLRAIQELDRAALELQHKSVSNTESKGTDAISVAGMSGSSADASSACLAAQAKEATVVNLVEKMFMRPDDPRLASLHERRLRYLAYLQMERQIKLARANARRFEGVENTPEAAECRALYAQLQQRRRELLASHHTTTTTTSSAVPLSATRSGGSGDVVTTGEARGDGEAGAINIFHDATAASLFEQIRDITIRVIQRYPAESRAAAKAAKVARVVQALRGGTQATAQLQAALQEKKQRLSRRLLDLVEEDVKAEMQWLEAMQEAERPPLLPLPEGMSYVSAADVQAWQEVREEDAGKAGNPFLKNKLHFQPALLGQTWHIPDKPVLFWGTGTRAVQQALQHVAEDAERRRRGEPLAPPYPCPENPWGWRLVKDVLDD